MGADSKIIRAEGHRANGCLAELLKSVAEWGETKHHLAYWHFEGVEKLGMTELPLMFCYVFVLLRVSAVPL